MEESRGIGQRNAGENKIICFDVDGTLRDYSDKPRIKVIETLKLFVAAGWRVCVWSGGGVGYAVRVGNMLSLPESVEYIAKGYLRPDIAVDDQKTNLGIRNIQV